VGPGSLRGDARAASSRTIPFLALAAPGPPFRDPRPPLLAFKGAGVDYFRRRNKEFRLWIESCYAWKGLGQWNRVGPGPDKGVLPSERFDPPLDSFVPRSDRLGLAVDRHVPALPRRLPLGSRSSNAGTARSGSGNGSVSGLRPRLGSASTSSCWGTLRPSNDRSLREDSVANLQFVYTLLCASNGAGGENARNGFRRLHRHLLEETLAGLEARQAELVVDG